MQKYLNIVTDFIDAACNRISYPMPPKGGSKANIRIASND